MKAVFCFFNFIIANTWELEYHCTYKTKEKTGGKKKKRELHDVYKIKHFEMRVKATKNIFSVYLWIQPCLKIQK